MPLNERKIIDIILQQCRDVPVRCAGYQQMIIETVTDILQAERQHKAQGTNIQQRVNDKCNAAGQFLAAERARGAEAKK